MDRTCIDQLSHHVGQEVTLKGWLYNRRSSGKIHFLLLRDGTGICQCVASRADLGAENFEAADHLGQESALEVTGSVREDKRAPGGYEVSVRTLRDHLPRHRLSDYSQGAWRRFSARPAPSMAALVTPARDLEDSQ